MTFEGIICPVCSGPLKEENFLGAIVCPHCNTKLKQKKYLAFLEFLMMQGLVTDIDFFDEALYGHEIQKSETEEELLDETIHDEVGMRHYYAEWGKHVNLDPSNPIIST